MLIIKGIIIGIGKIIPGVSGAMIAISFGLYQKMIDAVNNIFKDFKNNAMFLVKIGIGVFISIIFFSNLILNCIHNYYIITIFLFLGLILGGLDDIVKNLNKSDIYISVIIFIIVFLLGIANINNNLEINSNIEKFIFYVLAGFIDSITMIIPGISGTATLMMIGAYDKIIETLANIANFSILNSNLNILFPFIIGMIIGIILTSKLIDFLFKKYNSKAYSAIFGFSLATIFLMIVKCINAFYTIKDLIIAFMMLLIGMIIIKKINSIKN